MPYTQETFREANHIITQAVTAMSADLAACDSYTHLMLIDAANYCGEMARGNAYYSVDLFYKRNKSIACAKVWAKNAIAARADKFIQRLVASGDYEYITARLVQPNAADPFATAEPCWKGGR